MNVSELCYYCPSPVDIIIITLLHQNWNYKGTLSLTWIIFNPVWISNHELSKVWDEISYPFPNFNSCTIEVGMEK